MTNRIRIPLPSSINGGSNLYSVDVINGTLYQANANSIRKSVPISDRYIDQPLTFVNEENKILLSQIDNSMDNFDYNSFCLRGLQAPRVNLPLKYKPFSKLQYPDIVLYESSYEKPDDTIFTCVCDDDIATMQKCDDDNFVKITLLNSDSNLEFDLGSLWSISDCFYIGNTTFVIVKKDHDDSSFSHIYKLSISDKKPSFSNEFSVEHNYTHGFYVNNYVVMTSRSGYYDIVKVNLDSMSFSVFESHIDLGSVQTPEQWFTNYNKKYLNMNNGNFFYIEDIEKDGVVNTEYGIKDISESKASEKIDVISAYRSRWDLHGIHGVQHMASMVKFGIINPIVRLGRIPASATIEPNCTEYVAFGGVESEFLMIASAYKSKKNTGIPIKGFSKIFITSEYIFVEINDTILVIKIISMSSSCQTNEETESLILG